MKTQQSHKQWWAPVWKGLVMDVEAKHYRAMKNALWLYLYLLLNANRKSGLLSRKINTLCNDMGVTRDTALRWLKILRCGGYIQTRSTGRALIIQVTRWKALAGVGKTSLMKPVIEHLSDSKNPIYRQSPFPAIPLRTSAFLGFKDAANDTNTKENNNNDRYGGVGNNPRQRGFTSIGASIRQERLAQELATKLNDAVGINLYRSYVAKYPEWLLRNVLSEVEAMPPEKISKGRGALFNYLVQHYAKGTTEDFGA